MTQVFPWSLQNEGLTYTQSRSVWNEAA